MDTMTAALMFPGLFLLIFMGIPVAFSLITVSLVAGWFAFGPIIFQQLYGSIYSASSNYVLSSIPLFVLMGAILEKSGIAKNLFDAIQMWIGTHHDCHGGHICGGLWRRWCGRDNDWINGYTCHASLPL